MGELLAELDQCVGGGPVASESGPWFRRLVHKLVGVPERDPTPAGDLEASTGLEILRELAAWDADLYRTSGSLMQSFARLDRLTERLGRVLRDRAGHGLGALLPRGRAVSPRPAGGGVGRHGAVGRPRQ